MSGYSLRRSDDKLTGSALMPLARGLLAAVAVELPGLHRRRRLPRLPSPRGLLPRRSAAARQAPRLLAVWVAGRRLAVILRAALTVGYDATACCRPIGCQETHAVSRRWQRDRRGGLCGSNRVLCLHPALEGGLAKRLRRACAHHRRQASAEHRGAVFGRLAAPVYPPAMAVRAGPALSFSSPSSCRGLK